MGRVPYLANVGCKVAEIWPVVVVLESASFGSRGGRNETRVGKRVLSGKHLSIDITRSTLPDRLGMLKIEWLGLVRVMT